MHFFTCKSCFSFWTLWRSRTLDRGFLPNKSSAGETPVDVWEVMRNRLSWYSGFHTSFFDLLGAFFEGFDGPFSRSVRGMMVWSRSDMPDLIHLQEVVELVSDKIAAIVGHNHFRESVSCKSDPQPSYRCARGWACYVECLNPLWMWANQNEKHFPEKWTNLTSRLWRTQGLCGNSQGCNGASCSLDIPHIDELSSPNPHPSYPIIRDF